MNSESHYSGTSGGSICALHACSEMSCEEILELIIKMSSDPIVWKNMDAALRLSLAALVTEEALQRCQGRLHVTTTKVWPNPTPRVTIISRFTSTAHLIDCVAASCFIPLYGDTKLTVRIGPTEEKYIDGGVFAMIPPVGKVTISPFGNEHFRLGGPPNFRPIDIHLDRKEYPLGKLLYRTLHPAPESELRRLCDKGVEAAERWLERRADHGTNNRRNFDTIITTLAHEERGVGELNLLLAGRKIEIVKIPVCKTMLVSHL